MVISVVSMCECCGLSEECTPEYIDLVRERHLGRWLCGLCAEAVKDEIRRAGRIISNEEAIERHASFSRDFRVRDSARKSVDSAELLITATRRLIRRSLSSARLLRSTSARPRSGEEEEGAPSRVAQPAVSRRGRCSPTSIDQSCSENNQFR
ncbi:hypothetical protein HPP92_019118 [Vanilla planifolia]|uniref:DUF1677 family protein n=1 Tax=Vanilla planifolia TaxID=51239 RepID=A0A835QEX5_VANPL|nr:hypothetical protein HPP92_019118 [Vanilla planifolia]